MVGRRVRCRMRALALAFALLACACSAATGPTGARTSGKSVDGAAAATAAPAPPIEVVPMKLSLRITDPPTQIVELRADGSVVSGKGELLGRIQGSKVVDNQGKEVLSVRGDGKVVFPELEDELKFNDDGDLVDDKGVIRIGSDGTLVTIESGGSPTRLPLRFEGFKANGRRAAVVTLLLMAKRLGATMDLTL